jgi:2-oxoglutarate ferredoxin oxidoreductase subunit delta
LQKKKIFYFWRELNNQKFKKIMAKIRGAVVVDVEGCKGCGVCVPACPSDVLDLAKEVNGKGYNYSYMKVPEACVGCANCAIVCPDGVITVYKVKVA